MLSTLLNVGKYERGEFKKSLGTIALISHASKVMLKILQARLQQYLNGGLPDVQAGFRRCRRTRDQIAMIHWIMEKEENSRRILVLLHYYAKAFDYVDHNKLRKILQEMEIPDNLYLPPEKPVCRSRSNS